MKIDAQAAHTTRYSARLGASGCAGSDGWLKQRKDAFYAASAAAAA
ncbi:hypothetical protein [Orrella daihaiensis]|uniref:Uncharacterized protein n=1 Tax=Orrella daihaiensis TaxID=2782176 RepID=A0ABY4AMT2_9BURK|nr:hypothetical protein [Orrella daihaiensis]UOD50380.1 hypothetical protein DHf2319_00025 [Orrella daihaiensis]